MHDEIELKLALSPDDQRRLRRHPLVRSLARGRARTRTLVSTYFDTPERDLLRQGMALRVRQIGRTRVQTLKAAAGEGGDSAGGAAKHYLEFECEIQGETPDLALIEDETLQSRFAADGIAERLAPVFTTSFKRAAIPMRFADSELELALDQGEITAGDSEAPICEAELELVSGRPTRLYELALALSERIAFRLERRTKAARGYALSEPVVPKAVKASEIALAPGMSARMAFEIAARACLTQIRANEPVVLAGEDLEGVHQLRVGVRRLRALIAAFKGILLPDAVAFLREELSWLQKSLGAAREWDVFIDETLVPLTARLGGPAGGDGSAGVAGLAELEAAARASRARAYEAAGAALLDPRYARLILRLDLWLEDGGWLLEAAPGELPPCEAAIAGFASAILDRRDKRLRKLSRRHEVLSEAEMHGVRLLAKKKRYCLETLGSLYSTKAVRGALASLKSIQDSLGRFNDAVVGRLLLAELERSLGPKAFAPLAEAAIAVRGWQAATMEQDIQSFRRMWAEYEAGRRFWRK